MEKVILRSHNSYDGEKLKVILDNAFQELDFSIQNARVLIKPNLLIARSPDKAVTTHPTVIQAIAELLKKRGCTISVGDSPGFESTERVLRTSGIMDVIRQLGLTVSLFDRQITKRSQGVSPYKEFIFGEDPSDYDAVINVPKLKTHGMMVVTLGIKNTFGFIHAFHKAKWHLKAGQDRSLFASTLIDIHNLAKPALTILDGIVGMDGDGPSSGRPRNLGILGISRNAYCLDDCIERIIGLPNPAPVTERAIKHALLPKYEICGDTIHPIKDFVLSSTMKTDWNLPSVVKHLLKNTFIGKPRVKKNICKACSVCVKVCPAQAITLRDNRPFFDYQKCIRCYCCQELCPESAIIV